jgi:hypothetical protein
LSLDVNTVLLTIVPTALAIGTAIVGLWKVFNEYKRSNEIKEKELRQQRQQVLFPLIKEFEDQKLDYAKRILDDYSISLDGPQEKVIIPTNGGQISEPYGNLKKFLISQLGLQWVQDSNFLIKNDHLELQSNQHRLQLYFREEGPLQTMAADGVPRLFRYSRSKDGLEIIFCYHISMISTILRDHNKNPIVNQLEDEIRNSFDAMLDFFGKLGYLLKLRLIERGELVYFQYYLEKMINNNSKAEDGSDDNAFIYYSRIYEFRLFALLLSEIDKMPSSMSSILPSKL